LIPEKALPAPALFHLDRQPAGGIPAGCLFLSFIPFAGIKPDLLVSVRSPKVQQVVSPPPAVPVVPAPGSSSGPAGAVPAVLPEGETGFCEAGPEAEFTKPPKTVLQL